MSWLHRTRALVRNLFRRETVDRELDQELSSYLDLTADEAEAAGHDPDVARRRARLHLGGVASVTESVRSARAGAAIERLGQDIKYALRGLRRTPGFAAAAMLTLTLGIGANAVIFSVVDAAIFKPLPYRDPQQLVEVAEVFRRGTGEQTMQIGMTWPQVDRWRSQPQLFSALATFMGQSARVASPLGTTPLQVSFISPDLPHLLGIEPKIGRAFVADEPAGDDAAVLLAEEFWRSAFRADANVIGRRLSIDAREHTIVGVMPATMRWGVGGARVVAWLPLDERSQRSGGRAFVGSIARLRSGLTLEAAQAELTRTVDRLQPGVSAERRWDAELIPLDRRAWSGDTMGRALIAVLGAVTFVLLIASTNVANLVLARALSRQREVFVRAALGATRGRLFRQFVTEGLVLIAGAAATAYLLTRFAAAMIPVVVPREMALFEANPLAVDSRSMMLGAAAVLVSAVFCCLLPALRASRVGGLIVEGSPRVAGPATSGRRLRLGLQASQVALTVVLLTGAGLLMSSFVRMITTPAGYDVDRLAAASLTFPRSGYQTPASQTAFLDELLRRLRATPGVRAELGQAPPQGFAGRLMPYGHETDRVPKRMLSVYYVAPDWAVMAGIPLRAGRWLTSADGASSPVGLIDEQAAALFWPGQSPLGQRFRYSPNGEWVTVVGVVGAVKTRWFTAPTGTIQVYLPVAQFPFIGFGNVVARTEGDVHELVGAIASAIRSIDPRVELGQAAPVSELYEDVLVEPRFFLLLMMTLAMLALTTASVGLYAVVNCAVGERTREIGVRLALGADLNGVRRLVLREALTPVGLGLTIGLAGSMYLAEFVKTLLFDVGPRDPRTYGAVTLFLLGVAAIAAYLPARRASKIDPIEVLRSE